MAPRVKRKEKKQEENAPEPSAAEEETEVAQDDNQDEDLSSDSEEESADEENDEDKDEDGIPLSDLDSDAGEGEDVDIVPYTKVFKDNHAALTQALSTFALPISSLPFHVHQSVTSTESVTIDVNDDLQRELAFYKQALEAAKEGRKQLLAEGIPFSRPLDYFAEMVKDDEHMEKIRDRIVAEEAQKKASEAAKRQRDLKKFGKQVQVSKLQEREKEKRQTLDKIKALKRKRQDGNTLTTEDDFDVELEAANPEGKRTKMTREKRNERYGFGGSKRKQKRDDEDAGDLSAFDRRGGGGFRGRGGKRKGPQRPGKARRMQHRSK